MKSWTSQITLVAALMATFVVGCSKSSPNPVISFRGYEVSTEGMRQATFEFKNPSQSVMVCQVQVQPGRPGNIIDIQAGGSRTMSVRQTNATSFSVTVMRLVPVRKITMPIP